MTDMKCRHCTDSSDWSDCWLGSEKAKLPCPGAASGRHAWVKAVRRQTARVAYSQRGDDGECRLCGGSGGVFCPMSIDGEGPHRY